MLVAAAAIAQPSHVVMPVDRETGRPRGFAFVEFIDRAQAEEVIKKFDAQPFQGRNLAVSEARAREDRRRLRSSVLLPPAQPPRNLLQLTNRSHAPCRLRPDLAESGRFLPVSGDWALGAPVSKKT